MANYKLLKRLERIIYHVNTKQGITKTQLIHKIEEQTDTSISERTLERDLTTLRTEFGLNISYDHSLKGYTTDEDPERISAFFKFAELSSLAELYETGLKDYETFQKWVIPDDSSSFKGLNNMQTILKGITAERKIQFTKVNYYENTRKNYTVSPLRLKEYLNRWYVIAVPDGIDEIRTFGLDRLENVELLNIRNVTIKNESKQLKQFTDVVGLNYNETKEIQDLILKAHNKQIKYLRSLPLHHSQICIESKSDEVWGKVNYRLKPNFEFMMQILKLGAMVEVVEPVWFREKIQNEIVSMSLLYK